MERQYLEAMEKTKGGTMKRTTGRTVIAGALVIAALVFFGFGTSYAKTSYLTAFETAYPFAKGTAIDVCILCHNSPKGGSRNAYGSAYGGHSHSFTAIQNLDSDVDTFSNIKEIRDLTFPGNAASKPKPPTVTVFTVAPAATPPHTAKITAIAATSPSSAKIVGYMVTETAAKPAATATGWSAIKPRTYTFATAGAKTLYAWAKDRAGLVSAGKSAPVTVAAPVVLAPAASAPVTASPAAAAPGNVTFDGTTLYMQRCSACHGSIQRSQVRGATAADIKTAIVEVSEMAFLKFLTDPKIQAIADALVTSTPPPPPPPPSGGPHPAGWLNKHPNYVDRNGTSSCTACHGKDLKGGAGPSCFSCHSGAGDDD
jgi:hypothetical protein